MCPCNLDWSVPYRAFECTLSISKMRLMSEIKYSVHQQQYRVQTRSGGEWGGSQGSRLSALILTPVRLKINRFRSLDVDHPNSINNEASRK